MYAKKIILIIVISSLSCNSFLQATKNQKFSLEKIQKTFTPLFDGKQESLDKNWQAQTGYKVNDDNTLNGNGLIYTKKLYQDFIFYSEFKFTKKKANSGYGFKALKKGAAAYNGFELQILDDEHYGDNLREYQYHGCVYGVVIAKRNALKPFGEWNKEIVIIKGNNIKVILNDIVIIDTDLSKHTPLKNPKGTQYAQGLLNPKGFISIMGHGGGVTFRNLYIKVIK